MSEWEGIYVPETMLVVPQTTPATVKISRHFYKVIRLSLQIKVASTTDSYIETHRGRGIEHYHQLKRIFHSLWPVSDHSIKKHCLLPALPPPNDISWYLRRNL